MVSADIPPRRKLRQQFSHPEAPPRKVGATLDASSAAATPVTAEVDDADLTPGNSGAAASTHARTVPPPAASHTDSSDDEVSLKQIWKLLKSMPQKTDLENLATKADLETAKSAMQGHTNTAISEAMAPVNEQLQSLEARVSRLEAPSSNKNFNDKHDPAFSQLSFYGFSDESLQSRVSTLAEFMRSNFPSEYVACIDTRMKGPFTNRTPSDTSYVQFFNRVARDRVFDLIKERKCGDNLRSEKGSKLTINKMKTELQRERDWAMRKAESIVKGSSEFPAGASLKYESTRDVRRLTVNGVEAFVQARDDRRGKFVGTFSSLVFPP